MPPSQATNDSNRGDEVVFGDTPADRTIGENTERVEDDNVDNTRTSDFLTSENELGLEQIEDGYQQDGDERSRDDQGHGEECLSTRNSATSEQNSEISSRNFEIIGQGSEIIGQGSKISDRGSKISDRGSTIPDKSGSVVSAPVWPLGISKNELGLEQIEDECKDVGGGVGWVDETSAHRLFKTAFDHDASGSTARSSLGNTARSSLGNTARSSLGNTLRNSLGLEVIEDDPELQQLEVSTSTSKLAKKHDQKTGRPSAPSEVARRGSHDDGHNGLAVATAVEDDEQIYAAVEYDPDSKPPLYHNRRCRAYSALALVALCAAAAVVAVRLARASPPVIEIESGPTSPPSGAPTTNREGAGIRERIEAGVLQRGAVFDKLKERDARLLALEWILNQDERRVGPSDGNLYQRYVLALLAYSLDSSAWYSCGNSTNFANLTFCEEEEEYWLSGADECDWYGVFCSDGIVRGLELPANDLIGELPPEIARLRFLQVLALDRNCLHGTIPSEMGEMASLQRLDLSSNGLSGHFPDQLFGLSGLVELNIGYQKSNYRECVRSDGTVVSNLFRRGDVAREYNLGIEGKILETQIGRLSSLKSLVFTDNGVNGTISTQIGTLKQLTFLRVGNNKLQGEIPSVITRLENLRELIINYNQNIYGGLPSNIGDMKSLETLAVNDADIGGAIPHSLYDLTKLKTLFLHDTLHCGRTGGCAIDHESGFQGSISPAIGNLTKLSTFMIQNNPITGVLPSELGLCHDLSTLFIHFTQIQGTVPIEVCRLRDKKLDPGIELWNSFYADCWLNNKTMEPFLTCDCCTDCCDHTLKVCFNDD